MRANIAILTVMPGALYFYKLPGQPPCFIADNQDISALRKALQINLLVTAQRLQGDHCFPQNIVNFKMQIRRFYIVL